MIAPGFKGCGNTLTTADGASSAFNGMLNDSSRLAAWNWKPAGRPTGNNDPVTAVPSNRVYVWRNNDPGTPKAEEYDQCLTIPKLILRFYNRIAALRTTWGLTASQKIDVVGISFGTIVTRACIKNAYGTTPNCAAWIDDWIGLAGPAHGTTVANASNCAAGFLILLPPATCMQLQASPVTDTMTRLNYAGDETPGTGEFSTVWSKNDGVVEPAAGGLPSGPVTGSANWQAKTSAGSADSTDPTHANMGNPTTCPGWGDLPSTTTLNESTIGGVYEWAAYELLDVQPHGTGNGQLLCTVGPPTT